MRWFILILMVYGYVHRGDFLGDVFALWIVVSFVEVGAKLSIVDIKQLICTCEGVMLAFAPMPLIAERRSVDTTTAEVQEKYQVERLALCNAHTNVLGTGILQLA